MSQKHFERRNIKAYSSWRNMRSRCKNPYHPSFHLYGGRGITISERWDNFDNFFTDMGERPLGYTLDRLDNEGDYSINNCKWSTRTEQNRNKRDTVFTVELVKEVRADYNSGKYRIIDLARKHTIRKEVMRQVLLNRSWQDV